ncbi:hypothetical protein VTO42DRAFT_5371 [Malbranchea cinnamomea]
MTEGSLSAAAKRDRSADSRASAQSSLAADGSKVEGERQATLPAFLTQSYGELRKKFEELEWLQRGRISAALLAGDPSHRWALESTPEVRERNRYMNVQAWANSRIHLKVPEGECDFINASPIVLRDSETQEEARYIATQGPKEGYLAHFWNMIYHETGEIAVIVMLTQTLEGGREKCAQYFPLNMEAPTFEVSSADSDPFVDQDAETKVNDYLYATVTLLESSYDEELRSEIRKFELRVGEGSKIVWHYLFAGWSDYNKPEGADRDALLKLVTATAEKTGSLTNPRVVHCSAGVGRTGTFIALDHLLRELRSGKLLKVTDDNVDTVFDTVNQLREQRMMMVYNDLQYQFIYDVLREQAGLLLGIDTTNMSGRSSGRRAGKMPKLGSDTPFQATPKAELEPVTDTRTSTPTRSWSGTPEVSDNEPES